MPLPSSYQFASNSDLSHRFKGTIIEYKGKPVICINVSGDSNNLIVLKYNKSTDSLEKATIKTNDPGLNISGLGRKLGLFEISPEWIGRLTRTPFKGMSQGLCMNNTSFLGYRENNLYDFYAGSYGKRYLNTQPANWSTPFDENRMMAIQKYASDYNVRYEILAPFLCHGFHEMWEQQEAYYPKVTPSFLKGITSAVPVSKNFIVEKDVFDQYYLVAKGKRVGLIIDGRVKYLPEKAYIAQDVERATGLQAA